MAAPKVRVPPLSRLRVNPVRRSAVEDRASPLPGEKQSLPSRGILCRMGANPTSADTAAKQYDAAEADFLAAVKRDASRWELAVVAAAVRDAARLWQGEAWSFYFDVRENDDTDRRVGAADNAAEVAEAMSDFWYDLAQAYGADPPADSINHPPQIPG